MNSTGNFMTFSIELAQQLVESEDTFPVNLEDAVIWLGYTRKDSAVDSIKSYFEKGVDFSYAQTEKPTNGRPKHLYYLTVECFKSLALISKVRGSSHILNCFKECGNSNITVIVKHRLEIDFKDLLFSMLEWKTIILTQHFCSFEGKKYFIDFYLPEYNLAIEYDEKYHSSQEVKDSAREQILSRLLNCKFIRVAEGKELEAISKITEFVFKSS